jgi:hypothetical protein
MAETTNQTLEQDHKQFSSSPPSSQTTPTISSRPMTSDISISGIRLKKIDATTTNLTGNDGKTGKGRISSGHSAAHWGLKNFF